MTPKSPVVAQGGHMGAPKPDSVTKKNEANLTKNLKALATCH